MYRTNETICRQQITSKIGNARLYDLLVEHTETFPRHVKDLLVNNTEIAGIIIIIIALQLLPCPSDLGGQTASGPPPYIQVGPPGSDFHGPGAQKRTLKAQKT